MNQTTNNTVSYADLPLNTRVWVYQSNRELTEAESIEMLAKTQAFVVGWTAHDNQLKAFADVRYNRFLLLMVDEGVANASGCSIDKSVKLVKELEQQLGINLMDRMNFAYKQGDKVLSCNAQVFTALAKIGAITEDTIVFNNLVANKKELENNWEIPLKNSWYQQFV
jgi:hypothetical protein